VGDGSMRSSKYCVGSKGTVSVTAILRAEKMVSFVRAIAVAKPGFQSGGTWRAREPTTPT
jgi:hypothetical protein